MIKRIYPKNDKKLNFSFVQNKYDFFVEELPLSFTNNGAYLVLKVKKENMDTWELIDRLARHLNIYSNELGYAGLKDKKATTIQYISIPKKYQKDLENFKSNKIKILDNYLHKTRLNIGDLKANRFRISLYKVEQEELYHIQKLLKLISKEGIPNYFGYQRFGQDVKENQEKARQLIYDQRVIKDKKISKMLIQAYQSNFFNAWLVQRLKLKAKEFKLLTGDIFFDLEKNRFFCPQKINETILNDFKNKKIVPTGLLPGRKALQARDEARKIEEKFEDSYIQEKAYRREAIIFPKILTCNYNKEEKKCTLEFILPKGSYATVLIEYLANRNFS